MNFFSLILVCIGISVSNMHAGCSNSKSIDKSNALFTPFTDLRTEWPRLLVADSVEIRDRIQDKCEYGWYLRYEGRVLAKKVGKKIVYIDPVHPNEEIMPGFYFWEKDSKQSEIVVRKSPLSWAYNYKSEYVQFKNYRYHCERIKRYWFEEADSSENRLK